MGTSRQKMISASTTRSISLALVLFGLWLLLSGRYDLLYLGLGVVSVAVVLIIVKRMEVLDAESHPVSMIPCVLGYWAWLYRRIIRANLDVVRRIIDPKLPISPSVFTVKAEQSTDLCRVVYANSITLTPGTVFIDLEGDQIIVHALSREAAEELQRGEMNRLVCGIEDKL